MSLIVRPAHAAELQPAQALVVRSINDLTERHGFGPMASSRAPEFQQFSLDDDPDGVWIAKDDGDIVGFALSWVCDGLWFLAELFIAPSQQGRGLGSELLARTFEHARKAGASNKCLITFTFNVVSQGLYIRHGLHPRMPIYFLSAARDSLARRPGGRELHATALEPIGDHMAALLRLDLGALGVSREKHHRFLLGDRSMQGFLLHDGGECVAYAYISPGGHVGPLAVAAPDRMADAFEAALHLAAARGAAQVTAFVPGASDAIRVAVQHGMRITFPMVLLSERDFGDWTRYLPRNPGFM